MRITSYQASVTKMLKSARYFIVSFMVILLLSGGTEALAATERAPDVVRQEFDQSFQAMLADPTNIDKTLKYANLAYELKDYESAIPPLERLLMYNPKLTHVRLQVGVLYYLLNSHDMARTYLSQVSKDNTATAEQKQKADRYLSQL
ncbi:MAG: hypothetical protein U1E36_04360 [Rickettsiales bacterium]